MKTVCSNPIRNRVVTESSEMVAIPVGFGDVAPVPLGFHPLLYRASRSRGLSGNGKNSPTVGMPSEKNVRLPIDDEDQARRSRRSAGAVVLSFHRRTLDPEPT